MVHLLAFGLFAASIAPAFAQTTSKCNPTNGTACPPAPALGTSFLWNLTNTNGTSAFSDNTMWEQPNQAWTYENGAAQFTIAKQNQAPTAKSTWYIFGGQVSIVMKAAQGKGIVSSAMLLSDDLDEIDWEFLGDDDGHVQTNFYGKGNSTNTTRGQTIAIDGVYSKFHNYTTKWDQDQIQWIVDGVVVRTLTKDQGVLDGVDQYPQTPMYMSIGPWAGGDPELNGKGVVEWAKGPVDYTKAPFTMQVQSVSASDGHHGAEKYAYVNKQGTWGGIKVTMGNSEANQTLNKPPPAPQQSIVDKFDGMSTGAKIGIACGVGGAVLVLGVICTICCLRSRKEGRREREVADAHWDNSNSEMLAYREQMSSGRFAHGSASMGMGPLSPNPQYAPLSPNPQYAPQHRY